MSLTQRAKTVEPATTLWKSVSQQQMFLFLPAQLPDPTVQMRLSRFAAGAPGHSDAPRLPGRHRHSVVHLRRGGALHSDQRLPRAALSAAKVLPAILAVRTGELFGSLTVSLLAV